MRAKGQAGTDRKLVALPGKAEIVGYSEASRRKSGLGIRRTANEESGPTLYYQRHIARCGCVTAYTNFLWPQLRIGTKPVDSGPVDRNTKRVNGVGIDQVGTSHSKRLRQIVASGLVDRFENVLRNGVRTFHGVNCCDVTAKEGMSVV